MIYDAQGRPVADVAVKAPRPGVYVERESADAYTFGESRELTPEKVDAILMAANSGDTERQAKLSGEIEEHDWDIAQAVQTRRLAVAGLKWSIEPTEDDDDPKAEEISEAAEAMLRAVRYDGTDELASFAGALCGGLQGALLPGFAVLELVWGKGGQELQGLQEIEPRHFIFRDETGRLLSRPRLRTTAEPNGVDLAHGKFVVHYAQARPGARCRGGLIRPLAWLHCFSRVNMIDLLTFIERYGMPFVVAKVGQEAYATERTKLKALVRAFGPAGGAVLSEHVETELLQASNTSGDVYFRLLQYVGDAVTKVVLGQLATAGEAGGFSKGGEQGKVRQDLLEADCRALEETVRTQILRPWVMWNYGPTAPIPRLHLHSEPPEDVKATADTAAALYNAGLEWDEEEASERMGMKLTRKAPAPAPVFGAPPPMTGEEPETTEVPEGKVPPALPDPGAEEDSAETETDAEAMEDGTVIAVPTPAVPVAWDAPVREFLAEMERRAADTSISDADMLAWLRAEVARMPELATQMDIEGLAQSLTKSMQAAVQHTVEAASAHA